MNLENELRQALRREPAPPDFAAGILAKTRTIPRWRSRATLALAAGLVLAAIVPSAILRHHREEQRALEARDQLLTALRITRIQLQHAKARIQRNTRHTL